MNKDEQNWTFVRLQRVEIEVARFAARGTDCSENGSEQDSSSWSRTGTGVVSSGSSKNV